MENGSFTASITAIALAIVGVASLAVIVSRNSNTTGVIQASGNAFSQGLATAVSPVTGGATSGSSNWAASFGGGLSSFPVG
jgi:hypothetical protein